MDQERLPSFLGSLCLHLAVVALVLLWPAPEEQLPPLTDAKFIPGIVTIGKEGKLNPLAKRSEPEKAKQQKPVEKQEPVEKPTPKEVAAQTPPKVEPVVKPVEKVEPKLDPTAVPIPEDPKKITRNATVQAAKNATVPPAKNATAQKPVQNATKPKENLNSALADLQKTTKPTTAKGRAGASAGSGGGGLSSALADLGKEVGGSGTDASGDGPGGSGGDGVGILGAYEDSVVSRVRPNWALAERADRKNYTALVNIKIAPDGAIREVRLVRSSGNAIFDASVLRAVKATATLEKPPTPEAMDMDIYFNSDMMAKK